MSEDGVERSEPRVCLDLFAGSGGFSAAFEDSPRWRVVTVDNREETEPDLVADVMNLRPSDLPNADVVLVGHPCTLFSTAGNHDEWDQEAGQPAGDRARLHVAMVYHTLGLVHALTPEYWFLENPRGRLRWVLGEPEGTVTYCQYGTGYQKPTDLWGNHPDGFTYRSCPRGADCHASNTDDDGYSAIQSMPSDYDERSAMPRELSESILRAVGGRQEQQTLVAATDGGNAGVSQSTGVSHGGADDG